MFRNMFIFKATLVCLAMAVTAAACSPGAAQALATQAVGTAAPEAATSTTAGDPAEPTASATSAETAAEPASTTKLNLNSATAQDFLSIPGMGERMVREFEEYRPYTSILQFRKEIGKYVSAEQVAQYEQYVYVPISVDEADAATLLQIAGLDESEAEALIAGRPYGSNEAFLTALAGYVSEAELATARTTLSTP